MKRVLCSGWFWLNVSALGTVILVLNQSDYTLLLEEGQQYASDVSASKVALYIHVVSAVLALALGPLQLIPALRRSLPRIHAYIGRFYLVLGVGVGGASGLVLALQTYGGWSSRLGFSLLAVWWLFTGWRSWRQARLGNYVSHQVWTSYNLAASFAGVTLRFWLIMFDVLGLPFELSYQLSAWVCWLPNMAFVYWLRTSPRREWLRSGR